MPTPLSLTLDIQGYQTTHALLSNTALARTTAAKMLFGDYTVPSVPEALSGKRLWLRAKDHTGSVTNWIDQSGADNHAYGEQSFTVATASTPGGGKSVVFPSGNTGWFRAAGVNARGVATASTNFNTTDYPASNAIDSKVAGALGTTWGSSTLPAWWRLQLFSPEVLTSYRFMPASQYPIAWTFEGSNNGSTWTTLDTRSGQAPTVGAWTTPYTFTNANPYTYYRINVTSASGGSIVHFYEIELGGVSNIPTAAPGEIWAVVKSTANGALWDGGNEFTYYPFGTEIYENFGLNARTNFTQTMSVASWRLYRITHSGTVWEAFLDNTSQKTLTGGAATPYWQPTFPIGKGKDLSTYRLTGNVAEVLGFNRQLTSGEVADLITYFNNEHGLTVPGGATGITGVLNAVGPVPTGSLTGTVTPPPSITGSMVAVGPVPTGALTGTVTPPTITGSMAAVGPVPTGTLTGTVTPPTVTGVLTAVGPAPTGSLTGTVTPPTVTGSMVAVGPVPTGTLTGTVTPPTITGALTATGPVPTGVLTGTVTPPTITGVLSAVGPAPTGNITGSVSSPGTIVGSLVAVGPVPTGVLTGTVDLPTVTGVLTATGPRPEVTIEGTVVSLAVISGLRVWDGFDWILRPVKVWDGTEWVQRPVRYWDGTEWVLSQ